MRYLALLIFLLPFTFSSAQNLLDQKIRKLGKDKNSLYFNDGIFHNGSVKIPSQVKAARHSYKKSSGYERFVIDFTTTKLPRVYGYKSKSKTKIYLDLFHTELGSSMGSFGKSKFIKSINYFSLDEDKTSLEVNLKKDVAIEVFYLESPARLVIDLKG